jgi:choline dehydrogenase-like flavoprotein
MLRQLPGILPHLPEVMLTVLDSALSVRGFPRHYALESIFEPVPNWNSRVTLGLTHDRLGMPMARIDWRLSAQDRDNFRATVRMVRSALTRKGIVIDTDGGPEDLEAVWPDQAMWCWHHMGTTRMHSDPRQGVVNAQCRVHDVSNLFVAGSSVFPTMGNDMPTLTIVALALRLADHLKVAATR